MNKGSSICYSLVLCLRLSGSIGFICWSSLHTPGWIHVFLVQELPRFWFCNWPLCKKNMGMAGDNWLNLVSGSIDLFPAVEWKSNRQIFMEHCSSSSFSRPRSEPLTTAGWTTCLCRPRIVHCLPSPDLDLNRSQPSVEPPAYAARGWWRSCDHLVLLSTVVLPPPSTIPLTPVMTGSYRANMHLPSSPHTLR